MPDKKSSNIDKGSSSKRTTINPNLWWILGLAAMVIVSAYWYNKSNIAQKELEQTRIELENLRVGGNAKKTNADQFKVYAQVASDPNSQKVVLAGLARAPNSSALVFWNPETEEAYFEIITLTAPPSGQQYQLWAMVDGDPVNLGVFDLQAQEHYLMKVDFIKRPQAFAVTLEKEGGSTTPTFDQMLMIGSVSDG